MKEVIEHAVARNEANIRRDSMFDTIMTKYFGSDSMMRIISTSDVLGGNHSLSLRRRDIALADRRISVIEKMPSLETASRIELNARELWLYERYFRGHRIRSLPEFYGSCSDGPLTQLVFEDIPGVRPNLKRARTSSLVLAALAEINAVRLPEKIPFDSWALPFMDRERIRKRAASMSKDHDLGDFLQDLSLYDARYRGLKRGLGHGDLHGGNILVDKRDQVFLIDWSRWGAHPIGSDFGKYMLGAACRSWTISIREHLRGYADALGAELDDVVFSARYTRIGFLLSVLAGKAEKPPAVTREILHHAARLGSNQ